MSNENVGIQNTEQAKQGESAQTVFQIQKIYLNDASFEQPNSPKILLNKTEPKVQISMSIGSESLGEGEHQVLVKASVVSMIDNEVLYSVEVEQAGLFEIRNLPEDQIEPALQISCVAIIYPHLRYNIADLISRAGFQPINLAEINFGAIYEQSIAQRAKETEKTQESPAA